MPYAAKTKVPVDKTRFEIEKLCSQHGATAFSYGTTAERAIIQFQAHDRQVRFVLPLPARSDFRYAMRRGWKEERTTRQWDEAHQQAIKSRWRALFLAIKAKLEAVAAGITLFEQEFFAHVVDPSTGRTVYELISPQVAINYSGEHRPIGLPAPEEAS